MGIEVGKTVIRAPIEKVFSYLSSPDNLYTMLRANMITEATNLAALPDGSGYSYDWQYKLMGRTIKAHSETVEYEPPHRFAVKSTGGIETISRWKLEPEGENTNATFSIEYTMGNALMTWLTTPFASNQVRYSVEIALLALKKLVEHHSPAMPVSKPAETALPKDDHSLLI